MRRAILAACVMTLTACGIDVPDPEATQCAPNVYIQKGIALDCATVMSVYRNVAQETGVDLDHGMRVVEFVHGPTLSDYGKPNAIGLTVDNDIVVVAKYTHALFHEALHLDDHSHCNWSLKYLDLFNRNDVEGAFNDECQHVHCETTHSWTDSTGQNFGNGYVCTPI